MFGPKTEKALWGALAAKGIFGMVVECYFFVFEYEYYGIPISGLTVFDCQ